MMLFLPLSQVPCMAMVMGAVHSLINWVTPSMYLVIPNRSLSGWSSAWDSLLSGAVSEAAGVWGVCAGAGADTGADTCAGTGAGRSGGVRAHSGQLRRRYSMNRSISSIHLMYFLPVRLVPREKMPNCMCSVRGPSCVRRVRDRPVWAIFGSVSEVLWGPPEAAAPFSMDIPMDRTPLSMVSGASLSSQSHRTMALRGYGSDISRPSCRRMWNMPRASFISICWSVPKAVSKPAVLSST